ncbi:LysR substrate-binding domain-containing protein [Mesorhizobium sp. M1393]|uniref:LysR substrate-binding domain-containing protein n=1 Tax=unclassified Mesorhizobium TaxID=325217 RepID=UPI00333D6546
MDRHCSAAKSENPPQQSIGANGRLAVKGPHAELSAALSGLGIALLPDAMTASHIRAGRLAHVLPELARKGGGLNLVYPSGRHQSVRQLIEFVVMKMGCA